MVDFEGKNLCSEGLPSTPVLQIKPHLFDTLSFRNPAYRQLILMLKPEIRLLVAQILQYYISATLVLYIYK